MSMVLVLVPLLVPLLASVLNIGAAEWIHKFRYVHVKVFDHRHGGFGFPLLLMVFLFTGMYPSPFQVQTYKFNRINEG